MTAKKEDIIVIGPQVSEKQRMVVRYQNGKCIAGVVSPIEDGKPIHGSVVSLSHIEDNKYRVVNEYKSGPAMVNSEAYKEGWDRTFN